MKSNNYLHSELTRKIINSFYKVYNQLGYGFLEKVYEKSLCIELIKNNILCERQKPLSVYYEGHQVGNYFADIFVENVIILELKAIETLCPEHEAVLVNYLKASDVEIGLLLNFGKIPQVKRKVFNNQFKNHFKEYGTQTELIKK